MRNGLLGILKAHELKRLEMISMFSEKSATRDLLTHYRATSLVWQHSTAMTHFFLSDLLADLWSCLQWFIHKIRNTKKKHGFVESSEDEHKVDLMLKLVLKCCMLHTHLYNISGCFEFLNNSLGLSWQNRPWYVIVFHMSWSVKLFLTWLERL